MFRVLLMGIVVCSQLCAAELKDDPPLDPVAVAAKLESLSKTQSGQKKQFFQAAYDKLMQAMQQTGNAADYFFSAMKDEQYGDVKNGNADYAKWRKDHQDLFSDHDIERAAGLHLRYLALTLKRASSDSVEPLLPDLKAYIMELCNSTDLLAEVKSDPRQMKFRVYDPNGGGMVTEMVGGMQSSRGGGGGRGPAMQEDPSIYVQMLLSSPVSSGFVAKSLGVADYLGDVSPWEQTAGNLSGILEQDVRPYLRSKKDPTLLDTWDLEIRFTGEVASKSPDGKDAEKFQHEQYPRLLWQKAKDMELLGMPNRALKQRIAVAQQFPDSPDFEAWMKVINEGLKKQQAGPSTGLKETPLGNAPGTPSDAPTPTPAI